MVASRRVRRTSLGVVWVQDPGRLISIVLGRSWRNFKRARRGGEGIRHPFGGEVAIFSCLRSHEPLSLIANFTYFDYSIFQFNHVSCIKLTKYSPFTKKKETSYLDLKNISISDSIPFGFSIFVVTIKAQTSHVIHGLR